MKLQHRRQRRNHVQRLQVRQRARREHGNLDRSVRRQEGGEGGFGSIVFSQTHELIEAATSKDATPHALVAHFGGRQQHSVLGDVERRRGGDRVEVLHRQVVDVRRVEVQRDLVQIAVLALDQVEEPVLHVTPPILTHLLLEQRTAHQQGSATHWQVFSARQRRSHLWMSLVAVQHPVLRHHQHAAGTFDAGNARQHVRRPFRRLAPPADHVVQTQIQLVEGQQLVCLRSRLARRVLVGIGVVELQTREHGIIETHVQTLRRQHHSL